MGRFANQLCLWRRTKRAGFGGHVKPVGRIGSTANFFSSDCLLEVIRRISAFAIGRQVQSAKAVKYIAHRISGVATAEKWRKARPA